MIVLVIVGKILFTLISLALPLLLAIALLLIIIRLWPRRTLW